MPICRFPTPLRWMFLLCGLFLVATRVEAQPCTLGTTPWLTLTLSAGLLGSGAQNDLLIQVDDLGCARIRRPVFYRNAGEYRLMLSASELAALSQQLDVIALQSFDRYRLQAQINAAQKSLDQARSMETGAASERRMIVADADLVRLQVGVGKAQVEVVYSGLNAYAEAYPQVKALQQLDGMVDAVLALERRRDVQKASAGAP